jgi:hypothetical protein
MLASIWKRGRKPGVMPSMLTGLKNLFTISDFDRYTIGAPSEPVHGFVNVDYAQ